MRSSSASCSYAKAVNTGGYVVGQAIVAGHYRPILWLVDRRLVQVSLPRGVLAGDAVAINDRGYVAGSMRPPNADADRATVWSPLDRKVRYLAGDPVSEAALISARGQIVGYAGTDRHPVVWDRCGAKMTALPQVPGASFVDLVSITARGDVLAKVQLGEAQGYARSSSAGTRAGRRASSARVPDGPRDHLCVACLQAARPSARSAASAAQPQPTVTPEPPCP